MVTNRPLVTIICTNYNKGDWIRSAIDSFLAQKTNFGYEIILTDDNSTDNSPQIIADYAAKYPDQIRTFFNKKNKGITKTWIEICKEARGEYIARCDGDDYWIDEKKLQKQIDLLKSRPESEWSSTDFDIILPNDEVTDVAGFENGIVKKAHSYEAMLVTKGFTMASTWVVKTSLMQEVNAVIDENAVDDTFNIQLELLHRTKLAYLADSTTVYRTNYDSDSKPENLTKTKARIERLLETQLQYLDKYTDVDYYAMTKIALHENTTLSVINAEVGNELKKASEIIQGQERIIAERDTVIEQKDNEIVTRKNQVEEIVNSKKYKAGVVISSPVRAAQYVQKYGAYKGAKTVAKKTIFQSPKVQKVISRHVVNRDSKYQTFFKNNYPTKSEIRAMESREFSYTPLISIIMPTYNTPKRFLEEAIKSVQNQTYKNWELVIVDDASPDVHVRELIDEYAVHDTRITRKYLKHNQHIAGATNEGIEIAKGDFISLFDHDDILWPNALFEITAALNDNPALDFLYTDEDKVDQSSRYHFDPFFKPDWNPDFLRSVNYITHFTTIRKTVLDKYGYEDGAYNGAQDWELFLRITRNIDDDKIYHIPKIVYSWRSHILSTAESSEAKPYVKTAQENAIKADLIARGFTQRATVRRGENDYIQVAYPPADSLLISIIIPVTGGDLAQQCLESIYENTTYKSFEVLLISDDIQTDVREWFETVKDRFSTTTLYEFDSENQSNSNAYNYGVTKAKGQAVVLFDENLRVRTPAWLDEMVSYASRKDTGAVGAKIMNRDEKQIAQIGMRIMTVERSRRLCNLFANFSPHGKKTLVQSLMLDAVHNRLIVSPSCVMIKKNLFRENGGFSPNVSKQLGVVEMCLKLWDTGKYNVYLPHIRLSEHVRSTNVRTKIDADVIRSNWSNYIDRDPSYNTNLNKETTDFSL